MADIPGIIEGAHEGKGLGTRFLRHIERNAILLYVIPITDDDPSESYRVLRNELTSYNEELLSKTHLIALSKIDLFSDEDLEVMLEEFRKVLPEDVEILPISSVARKGLDKLRLSLWQRLESMRES